MPKHISVGHLYQIEEYFQNPETHRALMNDKKITVQRDLMGGGFTIMEE